VLRGGVPVAGVVVEFSGGRGAWVQRTYSATRGGGAFLGDQRIGVSSTAELRRSLLVPPGPAFILSQDEIWIHFSYKCKQTTLMNLLIPPSKM